MNDVVLIGGNHHNGLGLARSFGACGIMPYGVIIGKSAKKGFIRKSKFWKKTFALEKVDELVPFLIGEFKNSKEAPVLIPWSDKAALELDANYNLLSKYFILPSMNRTENAIVKLQNKFEQIKFSEKYGIPMAKSWIIEIAGDNTEIPPDIVYPCILKPVASAEGDKGDITKCNDLNQLKTALNMLLSKKYRRILCQEFVDFDYEFVFCGSCGSDSAYMISKNIRSWPIIGGTNSYFQCIADTKINSICENILHSLESEGYTGMFDIEMFCCGDRILLNEINWRNTGNSFFAHGTGVHYAVIWYYSMIGHSEMAEQIHHRCLDTEQYAMNEATDLRHVVYGSLSMTEWIHDFRRCQSFALRYPGDMKPALYRYVLLLHEMMHRAIFKK